VMGANREYTSQMKAATSPNGTGGNPKIGVPVSHHRSSSEFFYPPSCLVSSSPSPSFLPHSSQDSGLFSASLMPAAPVFPFASLVHGAPDNRAPPPPPLYSITIKLIFYLKQLTPMKTYEPPPCQRSSFRLRPKASLRTQGDRHLLICVLVLPCCHRCVCPPFL
jgi:hypothetical protein